MQAQEIMAKNPRTVSAGAGVREAAQLMKEEDVGIVPVVESGGEKRLIGLITDRDIAVRVVAEGRDADARVREIMSENPKSVRPGADVDDVLDLMGREKVRRIPVTDERGALVGIISQADVAREAKNERKVEDTVEQISQPGGKHTR